MVHAGLRSAGPERRKPRGGDMGPTRPVQKQPTSGEPQYCGGSSGIAGEAWHMRRRARNGCAEGQGCSGFGTPPRPRPSRPSTGRSSGSPPDRSPRPRRGSRGGPAEQAAGSRQTPPSPRRETPRPRAPPCAAPPAAPAAGPRSGLEPTLLHRAAWDGGRQVRLASLAQASLRAAWPHMTREPVTV